MIEIAHQSLLLAVKCCAEFNRVGDFLNWRSRRAAALPKGLECARGVF